MITQLRPFYTPDELAEVYNHPYDHTKWEDHKRRVRVTITLARWLAGHIKAQSAADLSCGDGAILMALDVPNKIYGDLVPAPHLTNTGPILDTLDEIDHVDLFILSETLEHVEEPGALLRKIRARTRGLILSTPVDELGDDNPEHYWGWGVEDIRAMLDDAHFTAHQLTVMHAGIPNGYIHQIWACV